MPHSPTGRALALVAALACLGAGAQTMYKWVDEKGVTHFSEHPPADDRKASKVTPKYTPPGNPRAYDPDAWKARDADAKKRQAERGVQDKAEQVDRARRTEMCNRARSHLASLQNSHRIYQDHPDGTRSYLDDTQRAAAVAKAREEAEEICR